jgi:hypothetical protein
MNSSFRTVPLCGLSLAAALGATTDLMVENAPNAISLL